MALLYQILLILATHYLQLSHELVVGAEFGQYILGEVANGEGKNIKYAMTGAYQLGKGVTFDTEKRQLNGKITDKLGKYPVVYHAYEDKTQNTIMQYIIYKVNDLHNPERKPALSFEGQIFDNKFVKGSALHNYNLGEVKNSKGKNLQYFMLGEEQLGEGVKYDSKTHQLKGIITADLGEYSLLYGVRDTKTGEMTAEHVTFKVVEDFKDLK